jgi:uncharacterized membrane protein
LERVPRDSTLREIENRVVLSLVVIIIIIVAVVIVIIIVIIVPTYTMKMAARTSTTHLQNHTNYNYKNHAHYNYKDYYNNNSNPPRRLYWLRSY